MLKPGKNGGWVLDCRPFGASGPRVRKRFAKKAQAEGYLRGLLSASVDAASDGPADVRRLSDLVDQWYEFHGRSLRDSKHRYSKMLAVSHRLGNPFAVVFSAADFARYRKQRLAVVSVETVNHETRYFRAMFNELRNLGLWTAENPMKGIRVFPVAERELSFLSAEQIFKLLKACELSRSVHLLAVVKLALSTGARWGEANSLRASCLFSDRVQFVRTKNGRVRSVPIAPELADYLRSVALPAPSDRLFLDCRSAFRRAVESAGLVLPRGQLTHVLRHTFASHFIMNGGSIVTLQKVLGHTDLKTTMRYAHLAPDYLAQVRELGPKLV
jgi:integrase